MPKGRMGEWRVIAISNAHGSAYSMAPWDNVIVAFADDAIVLSCTATGNQHTRTTTRYRGIGLGHDHYALAIPAAERCAILQEFAGGHMLDRRWIEEDEPEVWRLTLVDHHYPMCSLGQHTIHLALR